MIARRRRTSASAIALAAALLAVLGPPSAAAAIVDNPDPTLIARWEPCEPDTGVTVIVDRQDRLGDGKIDVGCALGEQESGLAALHNAGFTTEGVGGGNAFVCRIDGQPTVAEDACTITPGACCYWSYWHGKPGGSWGYSGFGATSPFSRAPVNSIEGWGFGGVRPRIYPMDGSGPSSFTLPPAQESSAIPAALARQWLQWASVETAELAQTPGSGVSIDYEKTLTEAIALARSGVDLVDLAPIVALFDRRGKSGEFEYSSLQSYANGSGMGWGIDPESSDFPLYGDADRYGLAIVALAALGEDPTDFAGDDLRAELIAKIDDSNGKIRNRTLGGPVTKSAEIVQTAPTVSALALTGTLPAKAGMTLDLVLAAQDPATGAFSSHSGVQVTAIEALVAARQAGASGLDAPIAKAADFLESLQEDDGGVRRREDDGNAGLPTFESTAVGAVGLALAGRGVAAEKAAKWVSRYQVTAEYAGTPDPVAGEPTPAEPLIGAFLPEAGELRNAIVNGLSPDTVPHGIYVFARLPTALALEALETAGPYGPHSASLSQESLWFGKQAVGTRGTAQTATLTNEDERSLSIAAIALAEGEVGDFALGGADCLGRTLASGQSCELTASFAPTAVGIREALIQVELAGSGQAFGLSLGGTGFPAPVTKPDPADGPGPLPAPQLVPALPPPGADSIVVPRAARVSGRIVKIASLSCPSAEPCRVKRPARMRLKIAGRFYWAAVLAPASLEAGESATVRLRLSGRALEALAAAGRTVARLKIEIVAADGSASRAVSVRITAPPSRR